MSLPRNARPALAAGLAGTLMATLCAGTMVTQPTASAQPVLAQWAGPVPLRLGADRASRDAARSDLTLEDETAAAQALADLAAAAERQRLTDQAAAKATGSDNPVLVAIPVQPPGGTSEQNRELGRFMTLEYGWDEAQFNCLDQIWSQESNWEITAENPSSGAYGIPQSLPGSKMATVAADWRTNPATQIAWGLGYIDDRYGTPCSAWSFKQGAGWY